MVGCYALALVLTVLGALYDQGTNRWLLSAGLAALAVGMGAGVFMRVALLVVGPAGRAMWWTNASMPSRAIFSVALVVRALAAIFVGYLALRGV
jgi:hypothetical protein